MDIEGLSIEGFAGLHFWGSEHVPGDVPLGLAHLRAWAYESGLVVDEDQRLNDEQLSDVWKVFTPEDRLLVLVDLSVSNNGSRQYLEYPFVPVNTLIQKALEIQLVYVKLVGLGVEDEPADAGYTNAKIGFLVEGSWVEFASETRGVLVVRKLHEFVRQLPNEYGLRESVGEFSERILESPEIGGDYVARFSRSGRRHDVVIESAARTSPERS